MIAASKELLLDHKYTNLGDVVLQLTHKYSNHFFSL